MSYFRTCFHPPEVQVEARRGEGEGGVGRGRGREGNDLRLPMHSCVPGEVLS